MFYKDERTMLFVDGANVSASAKALRCSMDWKKVLTYFQGNCRLVSAYYYTAVLDTGDEHNVLVPLLDWLSFNGYTLVTREAKRYTNDGVDRIKGNMDVDMAVGVLESCAHCDHVVLMTGDGDFVPVVQAAQRRGVRVTVVSTVATNPPMASDDLRRVANNFIELSETRLFLMNAWEGE